jgi:hypothetical protein
MDVQTDIPEYGFALKGLGDVLQTDDRPFFGHGPLPKR